jgi:hypothetical protein
MQDNQDNKEVRIKYRVQENTKTPLGPLMFVCFFFVLCIYRSLRWADHLSRAILLSACVSLCDLIQQ